MIIFGTRGVTRTSGQGRFHCPRCDGERPYQARRMRRFFTLYFIPLVPLDVIQEWIECGQCHQAFKPEVLRYDPSPRQANENRSGSALAPSAGEARLLQTAQRAALRNAARRVLAIAAGPSPSPAVRTAALAAHRTLFDEEWPEAELAADLARAASPSATLEPVSRVSDQVNTAGKEAILTQAVTVARAGGAPAPEIVQALGAAAAALGVSEAHWRGILAGGAPPA